VTSSNLRRSSLRVLPLYHYFGICDRLVEPHLEQTEELLSMAERDIVASDDEHVLVSAATDTFVAVTFETWDSDPGPLSPADTWQGHRTVTLQCPSAEIYIDQPTASAIDLRDELPAGPGAYDVRIAWRNRARPDDPPDDGEHYLVQMWRRGDLPADVAAQYADDDDD
jgi:hypothetical protein